MSLESTNDYIKEMWEQFSIITWFDSDGYIKGKDHIAEISYVICHNKKLQADKYGEAKELEYENSQAIEGFRIRIINRLTGEIHRTSRRFFFDNENYIDPDTMEFAFVPDVNKLIKYAGELVNYAFLWLKED